MIDQTSIRQLLDKGLTHYGLGQVQEACEVWKRVLEIDPQNPRAMEYMKFVEMNWAPNQPRDGKPYRPDEGSGPEAAQNAAGADAAQPAAPTGEEAFSPPAMPVVQASQWGDLYDFGSHSGQAETIQPPPPEPEPELPPEPDADLSASTLPPHPEPSPQESPGEPDAVTVSYASVPTVVRAPGEQAQADRDPPEALKLTPKAPFAQVQSAWDNPPDLLEHSDISPTPLRETDAEVFEQVAAEAPPDEQSGAALDLVAGSAAPALSVVAETAPAVFQGPDDVATLMKGTRDMLELDDFSGALDLLGKLAEIVPDNDEVLQMRAEAQSGLISIYSSKIGDLGKIPRVSMAQDEIIWLNLDHRAGFILSLVDGHMSFDEILSVSGLELTYGMRILVQLLQERVIEVP